MSDLIIHIVDEENPGLACLSFCLKSNIRAYSKESNILLEKVQKEYIALYKDKNDKGYIALYKSNSNNDPGLELFKNYIQSISYEKMAEEFAPVLVRLAPMAIETWNSWVDPNFGIKDDFKSALEPASLIALAAYIGISTGGFGGVKEELEGFFEISFNLCQQNPVAIWLPTMVDRNEFSYLENDKYHINEIQKESDNKKSLPEKPKSFLYILLSPLIFIANLLINSLKNIFTIQESKQKTITFSIKKENDPARSSWSGQGEASENNLVRQASISMTPQANQLKNATGTQQAEEENKEQQESFGYEFQYVPGNHAQLGLPVQGLSIGELFGLHTICEYVDDSELGWVPVETMKQDNSLFSLEKGVQIWKRPERGFGHFVATKKINHEAHDEIYIVDLRPSEAEERDEMGGLVGVRNDFMNRLCHEYGAKDWKRDDSQCHDYQIIAGNGRAVNVHIAQSMDTLKKYVKVGALPDGLVIQPEGDDLCGAIAAINAVRLSCNTKAEADRRLNGFSEQVFNAIKDEKANEILKKRYEELCANARQIRNEEHGSERPPNFKEKSWWSCLEKGERHKLAMYVYLSGCVTPKAKVRLGNVR